MEISSEEIKRTSGITIFVEKHIALKFLREDDQILPIGDVQISTSECVLLTETRVERSGTHRS